MSVQAGIRYFDGRLLVRQELEFLVHGLEARGPDYLGLQLSKCMGMAFRGLFVAPEDQPDQPIRGDGGSVITLDGRLDNRRDVASELGIFAIANASDAMLALLAYQRFGCHCFDLLKGEIACVVWDERKQVLFLFRSVCGTRPLFYVADQERILWSSELDDLVLKSDIDPIVNDRYALGYAYFQPDLEESPYAKVSIVPSGSYVEVNSGGEVRPAVSVWHPERISTLHLKSDAQYEEACTDHMEKAVARKLRTKDPVFCELSGGLDSTTLVMMSDRILKQRAPDANPLTTVSMTFETSTTCDETYFVKTAESYRGRDGIHICERVLQPTFGLENTSFTGAPNAHHFMPGRYGAIAQAMKVAGARVLLTGTGGDHLFWSDQGGSPELADLLVSGCVGALFSEAREWSRAVREPLWRILLSHAISPILITGPFRSHELNIFPWATKNAHSFLSRPDRKQGLQINDQIALPSRRVRESMIRSFRALLSAGYFEGSQGIYFSHPYSNQDLMEFVLAVPMRQLLRPGEDRSLMRRATRGLLPEAIRIRKSKGSINEAACRVIERERKDIGNISNLEVCRRNYANPQVLGQAMRIAALGRIDHSYAILRLMSLEQWLRSLSNISALRSDLRQEKFAPIDRARKNDMSSSSASILRSSEASA